MKLQRKWKEAKITKNKTKQNKIQRGFRFLGFFMHKYPVFLKNPQLLNCSSPT